MRVRRNPMSYVALALVTAVTGSAAILLSQRATQPILMDGHTHHLMRAYWEGTDPWKVDVGPFHFARARSYPRLLQALEAVASPGDVNKIAGENWLRVLNAAKIR